MGTYIIIWEDLAVWYNNKSAITQIEKLGHTVVFRLWRWEQYLRPKLRNPPESLHYVMNTQKLQSQRTSIEKASLNSLNIYNLQTKSTSGLCLNPTCFYPEGVCGFVCVGCKLIPRPLAFLLFRHCFRVAKWGPYVVPCHRCGQNVVLNDLSEKRHQHWRVRAGPIYSMGVKHRLAAPEVICVDASFLQQCHVPDSWL